MRDAYKPRSFPGDAYPSPPALGPGITADQDKTAAIGESILRHLLRLNSEFAHYVPTERQRPRIVLAAQGDPDYFPVGVKHRYTRR